MNKLLLSLGVVILAFTFGYAYDSPEIRMNFVKHIQTESFTNEYGSVFLFDIQDIYKENDDKNLKRVLLIKVNAVENSFRRSRELLLNQKDLPALMALIDNLKWKLKDNTELSLESKETVTIGYNPSLQTTFLKFKNSSDDNLTTLNFKDTHYKKILDILDQANSKSIMK